MSTKQHTDKDADHNPAAVGKITTPAENIINSAKGHTDPSALSAAATTEPPKPNDHTGKTPEPVVTRIEALEAAVASINSSLDKVIQAIGEMRHASGGSLLTDGVAETSDLSRRVHGLEAKVARLVAEA